MSNKPRHVRQGEPLSARWLNQLVDAVAGMITGTRGITVARGPGGIVIQGPEAPTRPLDAPRPFAAQIEVNNETDDFITVRRIKSDGSLHTETTEVAKPFEQRGESYAGVAGDEIFVESTAYSGVNGASGGDLKLIARPRLRKGPLFYVSLSVNSGDAGSVTTKCSFTYDVSSLDGQNLAQNVSPLMQRPPLGKHIAASNGSGYMDGETFVLLWCDEVFDTEACD